MLRLARATPVRPDGNAGRRVRAPIGVIRYPVVILIRGRFVGWCNRFRAAGRIDHHPGGSAGAHVHVVCDAIAIVVGDAVRNPVAAAVRRTVRGRADVAVGAGRKATAVARRRLGFPRAGWGIC